MTHWQIARAILFGAVVLAFWIACAIAGSMVGSVVYFG